MRAWPLHITPLPAPPHLWDGELLRQRHALQCIAHLLLAGRMHAHAQAAAAHRLDHLAQCSAGGAAQQDGRAWRSAQWRLAGYRPALLGWRSNPCGSHPAAQLSRAPTLETLLQQSTRRQAAEYFSMVRRSACWASLLSRSTSFSTSTWARRWGGEGTEGRGPGWAKLGKSEATPITDCCGRTLCWWPPAAPSKRSAVALPSHPVSLTQLSSRAAHLEEPLAVCAHGPVLRHLLQRSRAGQAHAATARHLSYPGLCEICFYSPRLLAVLTTAQHSSPKPRTLSACGARGGKQWAGPAHSP